MHRPQWACAASWYASRASCKTAAMAMVKAAAMTEPTVSLDINGSPVATRPDMVLSSGPSANVLVSWWQVIYEDRSCITRCAPTAVLTTRHAWPVPVSDTRRAPTLVFVHLGNCIAWVQREDVAYLSVDISNCCIDGDEHETVLEQEFE